MSEITKKIFLRNNGKIAKNLSIKTESKKVYVIEVDEVDSVSEYLEEFSFENTYFEDKEGNLIDLKEKVNLLIKNGRSW